MVASTPSRERFTSVRPLVRYVDAEQAVIETWLDVRPPMPAMSVRARRTVDVLMELTADTGFNDETLVHLDLNDHQASARFQVVEPDRWWPAGMGDQSMYRLKLTLLANDEPVDVWEGSIGLTSVRSPARITADSLLLVNGQPCHVQTIVHVDRIDDRSLLPVAGDSLLIVRDHYGPDLLYDAADRAGILVVQCVPIDPEGMPEREVNAQILRLASHPCLAGWYVGHMGQLSDGLAARIRSLDPSHSVFRTFPGRDAA